MATDNAHNSITRRTVRFAGAMRSYPAKIATSHMSSALTSGYITDSCRSSCISRRIDEESRHRRRERRDEAPSGDHDLARVGRQVRT